MVMEIDNLREIARCCQDGKPLDTGLMNWLGRSLEDFLNQRRRTIEEAMGLHMPQGGVPWWVEEALRTRDAALREIAGRFCSKQSVSAQARDIHTLAKRYAASAWRFDQDRETMPQGYRGTVKAWLWRAFKSGARMPICERHLRTILAH